MVGGLWGRRPWEYLLHNQSALRLKGGSCYSVPAWLS